MAGDPQPSARARTHATRLFVRCWGSRPLGGGLVAGLCCWWLVPSQPIAVPARGGVFSLLWPLVPVLVALPLPGAALVAFADLEAAAARRRAGLRSRGLALYWAAALLGVAPGVRFDATVVARNTAGLVGLALASVVLLPPATSWLPVVALPIAMWLFGQNTDRVTAGWAVLLAPADSARAGSTCAAVAVLGSISYLWTSRR